MALDTYYFSTQGCRRSALGFSLDEVPFVAAADAAAAARALLSKKLAI
jgi:hypothetical protein